MHNFASSLPLLVSWKHFHFERRDGLWHRNVDNELINFDNDTQIMRPTQLNVAWALQIIWCHHSCYFNNSIELWLKYRTCVYLFSRPISWDDKGLPMAYLYSASASSAALHTAAPTLAGERSVESWEPTTCWWRHGHAGRTLCIHGPHLAATPKDEQ